MKNIQKMGERRFSNIFRSVAEGTDWIISPPLFFTAMLEKEGDDGESKLIFSSAMTTNLTSCYRNGAYGL